MSNIESIMVAEYRSYLAYSMLAELTCYSATEEFEAFTQELAHLIDCPPSDAANLLLSVSVGIRDAIQRAIPNLIRPEVYRAAA